MASALVSQLAQIRSKGANPLDLKAHKKAHSQSLLFDVRVAATQDFETIFWVCHEGFQDLCQLDPRFAEFSKSIFSEQSKQADRTQMTALQNRQLDQSLERFLGMAGSKLLLKPALKAVEWLIRRFRIHEHNTLYLVLTFLPYHDSSIFLTLLSILPKTLPASLRFLHPYIESLASPPRHTIVYTASHTPKFSTAFNSYVMNLCRLGYHYPAICSFWAAMTTESVAAMLDQSRSGRHKVQKQSQKDLMLRLMPTLNEGLVMEAAPDLQIGCYMVLTVLATKVALSDIVLNATMEAIVSSWSQTTAPGLTCLAILAEQREMIALPSRVLKALISQKQLGEHLKRLKTHYRVNNITLGVILGLLYRAEKRWNVHHMSLVRSLLESELMEDSHLTVAIVTICSEVQKQENSDEVRASLTDLLCSLAEKKHLLAIIESVAAEYGPELPYLRQDIHKLLTQPGNVKESEENEGTSETKSFSDAEAFENALYQVPEESKDETSFLVTPSSDKLFGHLSSLFILASSMKDRLETFLSIPILRRAFSRTEPTFLSFFVRFWCSNAPAMVRAAAIKLVSEHLVGETPVQDMQFLFPYVVYGLTEPSGDVRRASIELVVTLNSVYNDGTRAANRLSDDIFGQENMYERESPSTAISLTPAEAAKFVKCLFFTDLEESVLDPDHISKHISGLLKGSKELRTSLNSHKELKTSDRQAFFAFMCNETTRTPLYSVRHRLLQILCQIEKVGALSRTKALWSLLLEYTNQPQKELIERCSNDQIGSVQLLEQVFKIVVPTDREGMQILQSILVAEKAHQSDVVFYAVNLQIQRLWPFITPDLELSIAKTLLDHAAEQGAIKRSDTVIDGAIETLRTVKLATSLLQFFLDGCLNAFKDFQNDLNFHKRRRTTHGSKNTISRNAKLILKRLTITLELVEISKPGNHVGLMRGLFQILAELQNSRSNLGTEMGYLQMIILESIHAIVKTYEKSTVLKVDKSAIRPDIIVESIRTTTSPQVQHVALLLISGLATISPESVLHSVMPVFTFMGAGILRQNDDYSVYVVDQTMESVIPRLAVSLQKQKRNPMMGVSELILSFVAAFEHVPSQRRLQLFKSLADKLGASDYLFAVLVILLDKHSKDRTLNFAAALFGLYDIKAQFQTIEKYLSVISDLLKPNSSISDHLVSLARSDSATAIANLLPLMTVVLKQKRLISKTRESLSLEAGDEASVRVLYERIMEALFVLSAELLHDQTLHALCQKMLDSLLAIPSITEFVAIVERLLTRVNTEVRLGVLKSYQQRLNGSFADQDTADKSSLAVLAQLSTILEESNDSSLKQAALASVDLVVRRFGKQGLPSTLATAQVVAGPEILGGDDQILQVEALLCLAIMAEVLQEMFTPLVPSVFPKSLEYLNKSLQMGAAADRLHNAAFSFIKALLFSTPWIITDSYLEQFLSASYESASSALGKECDDMRLNTLKVLGGQVDPQMCFTALDTTWETATKKGPIAVREYLEVLRIAIDQQPKSSIVKHCSILSGILVKCFDLRRLRLSSSDTEQRLTEKEVDEIESIIFDTTIALVYKLNDVTFRPMFRKILAWSKHARSDEHSQASIYRQTTFFTFLGVFFGNLKSIVTNYAGLIIDEAVQILQSTQTTNATSILLANRVVTALHQSFQHDQDEFWQSPTHFTPISTSLLHLLTTIPPTQSPTQSPTTIPALTALIIATDSPTHQKSLNAALLQLTRSPSSTVRLAAVTCQQNLTSALGEEWLAHLPEMLPFVAELVEDDDEMVERETRAWVKSMEEVLGEGVWGMLS